MAMLDLDLTGWFLALGAAALALMLTEALAWFRIHRYSRRLEKELEVRRRELEAMAERHRQALAVIQDPVVTVTSEGAVVTANPTAERFLGASQEEMRNRKLRDLLPVKTVERNGRHVDPFEYLSRRVREQAEPVTLDGVLVRRGDGHERIVHLTGAVLESSAASLHGEVLVIHDTTDRRKAEEEQARAERLEAVGLLAGGIAHDFNNLLAIILGNLSLLADSLEDDEDQQAREDAKQAAIRAKDLTQQLLTFSKGGAPVQKPTRLEPLIRDACSLVLSGTGVREEILVDPDLPLVDIDDGQINQVIANLLINAVEAMDDRGRVRLELTSSEESSGSWVDLRVIDEGPGIPEAVRGRMFEAYFSTKSRGSGLGLPTSFSIVHRHSGTLTLESTGPAGSIFRVRLPAVSAEEVEAADKARELAEPFAGRVLLMDDEAGIRRLAKRILERRGIEVEAVENGDDAVALFAIARSQSRPFDLAIVDLTVPAGMGGLEAAQKMIEIDPGARVIVCSGYANDPVMAEYRKHGFAAVLTKPFDAEDLLRAVREATFEEGDQPGDRPRKSADVSTPSR